MSYLKSPLLIIFLRMDVWKNKEKSLKTPWKCTSKVLEKSLKKVCHDLWEPWFPCNASFIRQKSHHRVWRPHARDVSSPLIALRGMLHGKAEVLKLILAFSCRMTMKIINVQPVLYKSRCTCVKINKCHIFLDLLNTNTTSLKGFYVYSRNSMFTDFICDICVLIAP